MRKSHFGSSLLTMALLATGCSSTPDVVDRPALPPPAPANGDGIVLGKVESLSAKEKELRVRALYLAASERFFKSDIDGCVGELQKVLALDPKYAQAYFRLSTCWFRKERYADEIKALEQCVLYEARHVEGWLNLGHALLAQEQLRESLTAYTRVIELDRFHPIAHYNSGLLQFEFGEYSKAAQHFQTALESNKLKPDLREKAEHYQRRCDERK